MWKTLIPPHPKWSCVKGSAAGGLASLAFAEQIVPTSLVSYGNALSAKTQEPGMINTHPHS